MPDALRARDAASREAAWREFVAPLVLEAGAGTGKTTTLVLRVVAWCTGPGWERAREELGADGLESRVAARVLGRVVAITFTEAAASKMDSEIASALAAIERDELPVWLPTAALPADAGERRSRARALRGALDHLVVTTIHAYCRRLLASHPLELSLHPELEIDAEGDRQREAVREVLEAALPVAYADPDSPELALARAGFDPSKLESELLALLAAGVRARELGADLLTPERFEALRLHLLEAFRALDEAGARDLRACTGAKVAKATAELVVSVCEALPSQSWDSAADLAAFRDAFGGRLGDASSRFATWAKCDFVKSELAIVGDRADSIASAARRCHELAVHVGKLELETLRDAQRALGPLLAEVERRLRSHGIATFADLLTDAAALLENEIVARRVRAGMDQLLVDEFQDTDERQCGILRALALRGDARPGLFVVGDPKQSIYGWRNADLAAYVDFVDEVLAHDGRVCPLHVNYRSVRAVLDEVACVMGEVMQEAKRLQPRFEPLVPHRAQEAGFTAGERTPVEYWATSGWVAESTEPDGLNARPAAEQEARALARDLRALHDEHGVAWQKAAVLFRGRADFEIYLAELRALGIPYSVEGDRSYYQRREVIDASALVRCVLDPNDHLALLASLRSTLGGVPDAALLPLWQQQLPALAGRLGALDPDALEAAEAAVRAAAAEIPVDVPGMERIAGWEEAAVAALGAIDALRRSFHRDPADVFVEQLRGLTLFEVCEAGRFLGAWRLANLDRFFRELARDLADGIASEAILRRLRNAVDEEQPAEEGRPRDLAEDAVQVLTIHGAKGLDFDHVYLVQLHKKPPPGAAKGVFPGHVEGRLELRLLEKPSLAWDRVAGDRAAVEQAERVRTLYVAMTRARDRLVLVGQWPAPGKLGSDRESVGLIARRADGLPDWHASMREAAGRAADSTHRGTLRWHFPGLSDAPTAVRATRTAALPIDAMRAGARRLRALDAESEARQSRAFGGAASSLAEEPKREPPDDARRFAAAGRRRGEVARRVGTLIHRLLEEIDLGADRAAAVAEARARLPLLAAGLADPSLSADVSAEAATLLDAVAEGELLQRLFDLRDAVAWRELPVLLPPDPVSGPTAYVSGTVDLVYRDPEDGDRYVVVDYKTDRIDDEDPDARSAAYAAQGAVYCRALRDALGLGYDPRFELWYLRADSVVVA